MKKKSFKICFIIGQLKKGGAEKQLYEFLKGMNRERFYPIVISLTQGGYWKEEIISLGVEVKEILRKKNAKYLRIFTLIKLLNEIKPDIVHTFMITANTYGRIAAIISHVPVVIASERSVIEIGKDKKRFWIYIDKLLSYFSSAIICNSKKASDVLINEFTFNENKVYTIYNGASDIKALRNLREHCRCSNSTIVIGTISNLYPHKNHKLFLDTAKYVLDKSRNKNILFKIIGDGPLKAQLEKYAIKLGIYNNVLFTGERHDIYDLLKGIDIFVLTSLYEGMSNAIMEGMQAGLPVIANDVGGNSELVIDQVTGYLCLSNEATLFAEKITNLIENKSKAKKMGEKGKKRILNEFSIDKMIKKTESVYMKLLR
jgi:glycosyltransferase involved in cell wall biosynthesis